MEEGLLSTSSPRGPDCESSSSSITFTLLLSTFIAGCASFTSGCVSGYSSPAESGIVSDLGLTTAQFSFFGSILTIGGMVGALISGKLADLAGRRSALCISEILCSLGWLAIAFAKNVWWIDIGRLILGFGLGVIKFVVPVYIVEITPKNIRGCFTSSSQLMLCFGFALMFFVGTIVNWRTLAIIGSAAGFINIVGLFFIPESPRWLEMMGREKDFLVSLQRLRGSRTDITEEANDIRGTTKALQHLAHARFMDLFHYRYAYSLTVGLGLIVLQQFCGTSAVSYYASEVFEVAGFSASVGSKSIAILQIPAAILGVLLIDKYGRRPLLLVSLCGTGLSYCLIGVSLFLQDLQYWTKITPILVYIGLLGCTASVSIGISGIPWILMSEDLQYWTKITPILVYIGLLGCTASVSIGISGIPWILMSEIFPINIKGPAGSLVSFGSWSSSWIVTYSFTFILEWSSSGTFFMLTASGILTFIFVAMLVPETKGKTLEKIEASMTLCRKV